MIGPVYIYPKFHMKEVQVLKLLRDPVLENLCCFFSLLREPSAEKSQNPLLLLKLGFCGKRQFLIVFQFLKPFFLFFQTL